MPTTKDPITKCTRPEDTHRALWPDCDRCWFSHCGYSRYFEPNPHWEDQHGICRFEHCIENMHIGSDRTEKSCPIFGHDCPDGADGAKACREQKRRTEEYGPTAERVQ